MILKKLICYNIYWKKEKKHLPFCFKRTSLSPFFFLPCFLKAEVGCYAQEQTACKQRFLDLPVWFNLV